jgi:hypothetical protein
MKTNLTQIIKQKQKHNKNTNINMTTSIKLLSLLSIFLLIDKIKPSLIGIKKTFNFLSQEFKDEILQIKNDAFKNEINFGTYNYNNPGLGKVYLSNFKIFFSNFKLENLFFSNDYTGNFILFDDDKNSNYGTLENYFTFNFEISNEIKGGKFLLKTSSIKFYKKFLKKENFIIEDVKLDIDLDLSNIELPQEKYFLLISSALKEYLNKQMYNIIKEKFDKNILDFYKIKNEKKMNLLSVLKLIGNSGDKDIELNIDIFNEKMPYIDSTNNFTVFMLSGITNKIPHNDTVPKFIYDEKAPDLNKNKFYSEISFSRDILKDIILLTKNETIFNYTINENSLLKNSPFDLNVEYLANIIPEITNEISPMNKIFIKNKVLKIVFNDTVKDKFLFDAYVESEINSIENLNDNTDVKNFHKNFEVFKFLQILKIELKPEISLCKINFYFDKLNIKIDSLKIFTTKYNNINLQILYDYLKNYFNLLLLSKKDSKFYLVKNPVDLSHDCSNIEKFSFTEYGFDFLYNLKLANSNPVLIMEKSNKKLNNNIIYDNNDKKFWVDRIINKKSMKFLG